MPDKPNLKLACKIAPALRMLYSSDGLTTVVFIRDEESLEQAKQPAVAGSLRNPMVLESNSNIASEFDAYFKENGHKPEHVFVRGTGNFLITKSSKTGRLAGKIAVVTGGAQGLGKGIVESLAAEGALVTVADINYGGALICANEINDTFGKNTAVAMQSNVTDEDSVECMIQDTVLAFGGLDIIVSNAGILVAGGIENFCKQDFDLVTSINYTGYFLCTKYAAEPMKIQRKYAPGYLMDIIEISSKSGLEGSDKNFAYAGSKFGGIGLTQSFAMELAEYGIKVNAICPGNLLDSPLWTDPEEGLFKQYLNSGKVKDAKSIDDVKKHYMEKVPMGRGCTIEDVACAVFYVIEQKYETGQAIPVTGGQVMLN